MEDKDPAAWAAAEQMTMKFRDLTKQLIRLYDELIAEDDLDKAVAIRETIVELLNSSLIQDPDDDAALNYIMYLVSMADAHHASMLKVGEMINNMAHNLEAMSKAIGMVSADAQDQMTLREVADQLGSPEYITGTGQKLYQVHSHVTCVGWCVIHNPIPGPWDNWRNHWRDGESWRGFERQCPHGFNHPAMEERLNDNGCEHACCGCPCGPPGAMPTYDHRGVLEGYRLAKENDR